MNGPKQGTREWPFYAKAIWRNRSLAEQMAGVSPLAADESFAASETRTPASTG
jgi:hypothetical protein